MQTKKTTLPRILSLPAPPQVIQTIYICKIASQTKTAMQSMTVFPFCHSFLNVTGNGCEISVSPVM